MTAQASMRLSMTPPDPLDSPAFLQAQQAVYKNDKTMDTDD